MSKTESSQDDAEPTEAPPRGKKKILLIGLLLTVAAAAGGWFLLIPSGAEAEEPVAHGAVVVLDPVAVNLAGGGYLKIGVALHLTEEASAGEGAEPDAALAQDLIIGQFSQARPVDIHGAREALKESLEQKIIDAYDGDVVEIYYTEYVTQ